MPNPDLFFYRMLVIKLTKSKCITLIPEYQKSHPSGGDMDSLMNVQNSKTSVQASIYDTLGSTDAPLRTQTNGEKGDPSLEPVGILNRWVF